MDIFTNIITAIITSSIISGMISAIITGKIDKNKYIFEKKVEAFTITINHILTLLNELSTNPDGTDYIQISEETYLKFKSETEKNILYLNKKNSLLLENITTLFANNVFLEQVIGGDPFINEHFCFDENERKKIIELTDELKNNFQNELGIKKRLI